MSDHEFINRGDRVRITIEGVHDGTLPNVTGTYGADRDFEVESQHADTITVELVERTVETFKPGDVLVGRDADGLPDAFVVGERGVTFLSTGNFYPHEKSGPWSREGLTSETYRKISLAEVPF